MRYNMLNALHILKESNKAETVFIDDIDLNSKYYDLKKRCRDRNTFFIFHLEEPYMVHSKNNYLTIAPMANLRQ